MITLKPLLLSVVLFAVTSDDLRLKPLPDELVPGATALDYHAVSIDENNEPLVDLRSRGIAGDQYYARADGLNPPYYECICRHDGGKMLARKTVAGKLVEVNRLLRPYGVELYVLDSYRPIECQRLLWKYFVRIAGADAGKYCSDPTSFSPTDSHSWPTHITGGAVDLTLRSISTKQLLWMGTVFDEASKASHTNAFARRAPDDTESVVEARRNRNLLYWAMHAQGFTNYPYEWWHFDYGTQMWVRNGNQLKTKPATAIYGLARH